MLSPRLLRARTAPRPGRAVLLLVAAAAALAAFVDARPSGDPAPDPLEAGLREAAANCARARRLPRHGDSPWFSTHAVRAALDDPRVLARAHGELDALYDEAVWLGGLGGARDLGDRSRGDVRFLAGLLHGYLAVAHQGAAPACDHVVAEAERVLFRDLTPADVLAAWD